MSNQAQVTTIGTGSTPIPWRSVGIWMTIILILYILFNAVRAVFTPTEFALYYGLPLADPTNNAFVFVYAIRALFLGVFGLTLLLSRNFAGLTLYVLVAVLMPVGDTVLVASKGASADVIFRQVLTAGFLLLTWFFLRRWLRSRPAK